MVCDEKTAATFYLIIGILVRKTIFECQFEVTSAWQVAFGLAVGSVGLWPAHGRANEALYYTIEVNVT